MAAAGSASSHLATLQHCRSGRQGALGGLVGFSACPAGCNTAAYVLRFYLVCSGSIFSLNVWVSAALSEQQLAAGIRREKQQQVYV